MKSYFNRYDLENPVTQEIREIDARSYVLAGVLGALYVLFFGFVGRFFLALTVDAAALAGATLMATIAARFLGGVEVMGALAAILLVTLALRSILIVNLVRDGYRKRGWEITRI